MRKVSIRIIDILSIVGVILLISFGVLAAHLAYSEDGKPLVFYVVPYFTFVLGCLCFIFTLTNTKKAYHMFISILLIFFSLVSGCDLIFHFGTAMNQWWPVFGLVSGIAWFASGFYKYKRVSLGYAVPAIVLFLLGLWYMLFSFKIIKIPFTKVVVILGPVYVAVLVAIMIGIYFGQKKNKKLIIQNEEPDVFADEEMVLTDMESEVTGD